MQTSKPSRLSHQIADLLGRDETQETPPAPQAPTYMELTAYHHGRIKRDAEILSGLNSMASPARSSDDTADNAVREDHQGWRIQMAALSTSCLSKSSPCSHFSSAPVENDPQTASPMLAALTTTGTPWISNPVIVNAF
ncbi:hypothetical protein SMD27_14820, partial [Dongia soli]